ncbi:MAG TPA: hypothetical protein VGO37_11380 [Steroidobacteraceae bacterium]|nr:hypothetical protein [Steroidobacteraceae bacterium]
MKSQMRQFPPVLKLVTPAFTPQGMPARLNPGLPFDASFLDGGSKCEAIDRNPSFDEIQEIFPRNT